MKILAGLNAVAVEGDWGEPRSFEHTVADEPVPGRARVVRLGTRGLTITNGAVSVAVPLAEFLKLAEAHEPGLRVNEATAAADARAGRASGAPLP